jgi:hypothetical protein
MSSRATAACMMLRLNCSMEVMSGRNCIVTCSPGIQLEKTYQHGRYFHQARPGCSVTRCKVPSALVWTVSSGLNRGTGGYKSTWNVFLCCPVKAETSVPTAATYVNWI